jgi:hypothetical protein
MPGGTGGVQSLVRRPVRRDENRGRSGVGRFVGKPDSVLLEIVEDMLVVNELAQDGDGRFRRLAFCEIDGITNSETQAEMIGANDFHRSFLLVANKLCVTK